MTLLSYFPLELDRRLAMLENALWKLFSRRYKIGKIDCCLVRIGTPRGAGAGRWQGRDESATQDLGPLFRSRESGLTRSLLY